MSKTDGIDALIRAGNRVASGEAFTSSVMVEEGVPARLRLLVGAVIAAAADRPASQRSITEMAAVARSSIYRNHHELLEQLTAAIPALVSGQLARHTNAPTVAALRADLDAANEALAEERERRRDAMEKLEHVTRYAWELHARAKKEYDAIMKERAVKVRPLRPVPPADPKDI